MVFALPPQCITLFIKLRFFFFQQKSPNIIYNLMTFMHTAHQKIKKIRIALAGQPNVGKSVIFNNLTGLSQTIGNWPGKTVAKAEGTAQFHDYIFEIIDLPGIYSLSTYSLEEIVSRDYILNEHPDYIINVIDATHLERNLFFTLQLTMLEVPMILALNQIDLLEERGYQIDVAKFSQILNYPVIPTIAVHNLGVHELLEQIIEIEEEKQQKSPISTASNLQGKNDNQLEPQIKNSSKINNQKGKNKIFWPKKYRTHHRRHHKEHPRSQHNSFSQHPIHRKSRDWNLHTSHIFSENAHLLWDTKLKSGYKLKLGKEVEIVLEKIITKISTNVETANYPVRFLAFKLIEQDEESIRKLRESNPNNNKEIDQLLYYVAELRKNLEEMHGEQIDTILNAELYQISTQIVNQTLILKSRTRKQTWAHYLDHITLGNVSGYIIFFGLMLGIYFTIFRFGDWVSGLMDGLYNTWTTEVEVLMDPTSWVYKIIWVSVVGGLFAGIGGVLPYVISFFFIIEILQDTGYLPRAAYLMDRFMHHIGVHGKTIIPILIGFGCNVPAVSAAMIMETEKEKKRAILISSMIPCSAVTTIVLGLVAKNMGFTWAVILYIINFGIIILVGRILTKLDKSKVMESELIIELHEFRRPNIQVIAKQTWARSKEFVVMALPLIVVLGILLQILMEFNLTDPINTILSPITVYILGLPIGVGVYLFYGVLRKELNLVLLELFVASQGLTMIQYMTPLQMLTFTMVTMLYIPCLATIITIKKETGWKFALQILFLEIGIALIIGWIMHGLGLLVELLL